MGVIGPDGRYPQWSVLFYSNHWLIYDTIPYVCLLLCIFNRRNLRAQCARHGTRYLVAYMSYVACTLWLVRFVTTHCFMTMLLPMCFFSVNLLEKNGYSTLQKDHLLARAVCAASHA